MHQILDETPNPALGELLRDLRCRERQADPHRFRETMRLCGTLLAHEIAKTLPGRPETVETPLGRREILVEDGAPVLLTPLRAGIPFLEGFLQVFRRSEVSFFGAARAESGPGPDAELDMEITTGYEALVASAGRTLILVDPMVATGSTILALHERLKARGQLPSRLIVAGLVGYRGALERLDRELPGSESWLVTCDEELDERGFIVPGLGDAGDLCFGEKVAEA